MSARRLIVAAWIVLMSAGAMAQTHAEMLERGIFTEDTAGDLSGAIQIYEMVLSQDGVPRDVAARARTRLAEARRKQEVAARARSAAMQLHLPTAVHTQTVPAQSPSEAVAQQLQAMSGCCGRYSANYDPGRSTSVTGTVTRVEWVNPLTTVYVAGDDGKRWGFTFAAPNTMIRSGWNRTTLSPGQRVSVSGFLATGTGECPASGGQFVIQQSGAVVAEFHTPSLPHACATLQDGAVHASASTMTVDGTVIYDRLTVEMQELQRLQESERRQLEGTAARPVP